MTDIPALLKMLQSENPRKRYDACEELRIAPSIPEEALAALQRANYDTNADVADAAKRALAIHISAPAANQLASAVPLSTQVFTPHPTQPSGFFREFLLIINILYIVTINIIYIVLIVPACGIATVSPVLLDGSASIWKVVLFLLTILFPLTLVITIIISWNLYRKERYKDVLLITLLPVAHFALFLVDNLIVAAWK